MNIQTILSEELLFAFKLNSLRQFFGDLTVRHLNILPPKDLLNRWLFMLVQNDFNTDELLLTINDLNNNVIAKELILSTPVRVQTDYSTCDAKRMYGVMVEF